MFLKNLNIIFFMIIYYVIITLNKKKKYIRKYVNIQVVFICFCFKKDFNKKTPMFYICPVLLVIVMPYDVLRTINTTHICAVKYYR